MSATSTVTLTQLCLTELAKQYVDTDDTLKKEEIAQSVPSPLVHQFITEVQQLELKPITELVHIWENRVDSWTYCTADGCGNEFEELAKDMLQFVCNPRKRLLEEKESWLEWKREVLSKLL